MFLRERTEGDGSVTLFTSSKSDDLFKYYVNQELEFGRNAGLEYGHGSYFLLDVPESAAGNFKGQTREGLYGSNLFAFSVSENKIFYFIYSEFQKTALFKRTKSTFETFIEDQLGHFNLNINEKYLQIIKEVIVDPTDQKSTSKAAKAFYRALNEIYYQNANGTLNSPIVGFMYRGQNDGETAVIWEPYALEPIKQSIDGGATWISFSENSETFKQYIARAKQYGDDSSYNEDRKVENVSRIFDGAWEEKKELAYRLLVNYEDTKKNMFLGNFSDIKINKNNTIDCTYKSNLPQYDGYRHYFRMAENEMLKEVYDLGFRFGTMNCGIKFGSESGSTDVTITSIPESLTPKRITQGLCFVNTPIDGNLEEELGFQIEKKHIRLEFCQIVSPKSLKGWEVEFNPDKPCFGDEKTKSELEKLGIDPSNIIDSNIKDFKQQKKDTEKLAKKKMKESDIEQFLKERNVASQFEAKNNISPEEIEKELEQKIDVDFEYIENKSTQTAATYNVFDEDGANLSTDEIEQVATQIKKKFKAKPVTPSGERVISSMDINKTQLNKDEDDDVQIRLRHTRLPKTHGMRDAAKTTVLQEFIQGLILATFSNINMGDLNWFSRSGTVEEHNTKIYSFIANLKSEKYSEAAKTIQPIYKQAQTYYDIPHDYSIQDVLRTVTNYSSTFINNSVNATKIAKYFDKRSEYFFVHPSFKQNPLISDLYGKKGFLVGFGQTDTWQPADIWFYRAGGSNVNPFTKRFNDCMVTENTKAPVEERRNNRVSVLDKLFKEKHLIPISLKKTAATSNLTQNKLQLNSFGDIVYFGFRTLSALRLYINNNVYTGDIVVRSNGAKIGCTVEHLMSAQGGKIPIEYIEYLLSKAINNPTIFKELIPTGLNAAQNEQAKITLLLLATRTDLDLSKSINFFKNSFKLNYMSIQLIETIVRNCITQINKFIQSGRIRTNDTRIGKSSPRFVYYFFAYLMSTLFTKKESKLLFAKMVAKGTKQSLFDGKEELTKIAVADYIKLSESTKKLFENILSDEFFY